MHTHINSSFWLWLYWISPIRYVLEALAVTVFYCEGCPESPSHEQALVQATCPTSCPSVQMQTTNGTQTVYLSNMVLGNFEFNFGNRAMDIGVLSIYVAAFQAAKTLTMLYVDHTDK